MCLGISEKYCLEKRGKVHEFRDFTFALPFPKLLDIHEQKALGFYARMASENGFQPKTMNVGGQDDAIFRLAARSPVAVCTTNVPLAQYPGIKFVKISDWKGCTNSTL